MELQVKFIEGYEGKYLVDTLGNIIACPQYRINGRRFDNYYLILKPLKKESGYNEICLTDKKGKQKYFLIHRLVAKAFIDNPNKYKVVNHKNGIKTDNRVENLEWTTYSGNTRHAFKNNINGFKDKCLENINKVNSCIRYKKIILEKDGVQYEFKSSREAGDYIHMNKDEVTRAIRKHQRVAGYFAYGIKANEEA